MRVSRAETLRLDAWIRFGDDRTTADAFAWGDDSTVRVTADDRDRSVALAGRGATAQAFQGRAGRRVRPQNGAARAARRWPPGVIAETVRS